MRNVVEYPITLDEIATTLRRMSDDLTNVPADDMPIGDMRPWLLAKAASLVSELGKMIAHAPTYLPFLPENPSAHDLEDHGAAQTEFAFAEMVRKVLDYRYVDGCDHASDDV